MYFTGDNTQQNFHFSLVSWINDENLGVIFDWHVTWNWNGEQFLTFESSRIEPTGFDRSPSLVPEPSTLLLFGTGLIGIGIFRRRFK
jgi:hypothetical protein